MGPRVTVAQKRVAAILILTNRFDDMSVADFRKLVVKIVNEAKATTDQDLPRNLEHTNG